jgi:hypothetical protein
MSETDKRWYLPNDETLHAEGPYSSSEIIARLQSGTLKADSFIFKEDFRQIGWQRIFQVAEFANVLVTRPHCQIPPALSRGTAQIEKVEFHFERAGGEYGTENLYRRFPRAPANFPCIAHDHHKLIRGTVNNISETGVLVVFDDPKLFKPGDELILTLRGPDPLGTFSVKAVVMRVLLKHPLEIIGINFLLLTPSVRRRISRYVLKELAKMGHDQSA